MDMSATAAVISVLGVGLLGLLGYFLQALRADIRRLDGRIDRLEVAHREEMAALATAHREEMAGIRETLGEIKEILASHTATLAAHGKQLERVMGHGERIAASGGGALRGYLSHRLDCPQWGRQASRRWATRGTTTSRRASSIRYSTRYVPLRALHSPSRSSRSATPTRRGLSSIGPVINSMTAAATGSGSSCAMVVAAGPATTIS